MRRFEFVLLMAVCAFLGGCGGDHPGSGSGNINGNWTATLNDTNNSPVFTFTTAFRQTSGADLNVVNFSFTTSSPCFVSGGTATGSFALSGNFNGKVTGSFELTMQSGSPSGNTLTLQGTVKNDVISGTWTLSGVTSGCTGNGSFRIIRA